MSYRNPQERVEECIQRVMSEHPVDGPKALARYFEAVHQELAPLARELERQRDSAWEESRAIRKALNANPHEATSDEVERVVAQRDNLLAMLEDAVEEIESLSGHDNSCDPDVDVSEYRAAIAAVKGGAA